MKRVELVRRPPRKGTQKIGIDTEIEITMNDGVVHRGKTTIARGHPKLPPSRAEIEDKLRQCADGILAPRQIANFLNDFWTLERAPSIAAWLRLLRPSRR